jgi:conjugal transfer pilus assembly protein TraE
MEHKKWLSTASNVFAQNRLYRFSLVVLCCGLVFNSFMTYRAVQYQRVILVPPHMNEKVEFIDGQPTDRYVEDMARRISALALTYSPATVRINFDRLLALYEPEAYPVASQNWYNLASRVEEVKVTNVFHLRRVLVDPEKHRIELVGERTQWADDKVMEKGERKYVVDYVIKAGTFAITSILEKGQLQDAVADNQKG